MARPARTVAEVCVARGGVMNGTRCLVFIAQWSIASQALDGPITLEEYRDWWRISHGTAYREQARFRQVFPGIPTPQAMADEAIARSSEWAQQGIKGFGQLPAAVAAA
jgi:hypothetical protein